MRDACAEEGAEEGTEAAVGEGVRQLQLTERLLLVDSSPCLCPWPRIRLPAAVAESVKVSSSNEMTAARSSSSDRRRKEESGRERQGG